MYQNSFQKTIRFHFYHNDFIRKFFDISPSRKSPGAVAANNAKKSAPKCSGAWTGIINYTRTQTATNNKTVERVSGRGQDTTNFEMNYNYKASVAVVESPEQ